MKVAVYGLGHLGCVTAACLATAGHSVVGIDEFYPVTPEEPGLAVMTECAMRDGQLRWSSDLWEAAEVDIVWVTFDTPVDEQGQADLPWLRLRVRALLNSLVGKNVPLIISSQVPAGTIRIFESEYPRQSFVCIPENLRHGSAIHNFMHPDRVVVGTRGPTHLDKLSELFRPLGAVHLEFMTVESAEMTKHAINAWMAMSICFANEIAKLCEKAGADPEEVERGMRTEERIGQKAYIRPGGPYEGRTLARDLEYLREIAGTETFIPLLMSIPVSNDIHRQERRK